jgi:hypothetical protein
MNGRRIPPPPTLYGGPRQVQRQAAPPAHPVPAVQHSPAPVPSAAGKKHAPPPIRPGSPGIQMKVAAGPAQPRIHHSPPTGGAVLQRSRMVVDSDDDEPKFARVQYGANQSETHHVVPASRAGKPVGPKLEHLYKGGSGERTARSFAGERPRQILRWIATVLFARFPGAVEIQCYWDTATETLWISSNKNSENKKIAAALAKGLEQLGGEFAAGRETRHAKKLLVRKNHDGQEEIFAALAKGAAKVPSEQFEVDFHAERRIQYTLGKQLDPSFLAGVKRPCLVCAIALKITAQSRPGPSWNSAPALAGYTLDQVLDHAVANGIVTHVTRDRVTGKLDTGHDTDSESDEE